MVMGWSVKGKFQQEVQAATIRCHSSSPQRPPSAAPGQIRANRHLRSSSILLPAIFSSRRFGNLWISLDLLTSRIPLSRNIWKSSHRPHKMMNILTSFSPNTSQHHVQPACCLSNCSDQRSHILYPIQLPIKEAKANSSNHELLHSPKLIQEKYDDCLFSFLFQGRNPNELGCGS